MTPSDPTAWLDEQIGQWRSYLRRRRAIHTVDVAELEDNLREQVAGLVDSGLSTDEAFLVAVKRMGDLDAVSREFAQEHSDRLWKQLVIGSAVPGEPAAPVQRDFLVAFILAVVAGLVIKIPALFGKNLGPQGDTAFYFRNASIFVLPLLTGYFVWKRHLPARFLPWLGAAFAAAAVFANVYPFHPGGATEILTILHLPIALWLVVGVAYAGERWSRVDGRMDFVRFSGELAIYYVLIALGGAVFTGFMALIFNAIHLKPEWFFQNWLLPCGASGAVLIASRLVEAKQSVIENMAPVLTRVFTPLFTLLLLVFLATVAWTGRGIDIQRDMLIGFDLLLLLVLGLLLYSISARDSTQAPGVFDILQVVLVASALATDAVALWAIAARISEFGFTPNRVAALGENLLLLVNLAGSLALYLRFFRRRGAFASLEKWQTGYLPVFSGWAAWVVIVFPPLFRYI